MGTVRAGDVEVMSAGTGISHSERNEHDSPVRMLQIWLTPNVSGGAPTWGHRPFPKADRSGSILPLASGRNAKGALPIRADAEVSGAMLLAGTDTVPSAGGSYWATFFPAVVVLGFGMAISVAPLTTTVMNSVPAGRAGIASGINNAVSRLAGVLAIAILGIVMLDAFERHLAQDAAQINLAPQIRNELDGQRIKLAAIGIPEQIDTATRERIKRSIDESFVAGFRVVMLIASGLALASAVTAWSVIRDKP